MPPKAPADPSAPPLAAFNTDEIQTLIKRSVDDVVPTDAAYDPDRVAQWSNDILENTVGRLAALQRPFKYGCTCLVSHKTGAGACSATSAHWDEATDGCQTFRVELRDLWVIVTVFGLAI